MHSNHVQRAVRSLACYSAILATLGLVSAPLATAQDVPFTYTVKFICGQEDGGILSPGAYFTAINVHNPNGRPEPVTLAKLLTVALPGEQIGGHTEFSEEVQLGPHDALEIDCEDIVRGARGLCAGPFCKGFVVVESLAELDVVAVYSATQLDTGQVTTLHTERVSSRCPIRTEVVPAQTVLFVPPHTRGDREFKGHGPCVDFGLSLEVEDEGKTLTAKYRMHAYECSDDPTKPRKDFTAAEGHGELIIKVASPRGRILGHDLDTSMAESYIDENHQDDTFPFTAPNPVAELRFVGDTKGKEAGTETGVLISLREIIVKLETCAPSASSMIN